MVPNYNLDNSINNNSIILAENVLRLRTEKKLSYFKLADISSVNEAVLFKIENNLQETKTSTIRKLAKAFEVPDYSLVIPYKYHESILVGITQYTCEELEHLINHIIEKKEMNHGINILDVLAYNTKAFRVKNNWTHKELSQESKVAPSKISKIENCKQEVRTDTIRKLAKAFKVPDYVLLIPFSRDIIEMKF